jgi:alpha-L-rhamnosidase
MKITTRISALLLTLAAATLFAQDINQPLAPSKLSPLDPTRFIVTPDLESARHKPLPEQYIWTASDSAPNSATHSMRSEPHAFRRTFSLTTVPSAATLYIAGPRSVQVWLNGQLAEQVESDPTSPLKMPVFAANVANLLRPGPNTLAIQVISGPASHLPVLGPLVAKIVPAAEAVDAPALLITDAQWKSATNAPDGWQQPAFSDASWKPVESFGAIESSIDNFQWNADAGLYSWPGYDGISPFLAHAPLPATVVLSPFAARGSFTNLAALTGTSGEFAIHMPATHLTDEDAPSLILDFGREVNGRVELISASAAPVTLTLQMGESEAETLYKPYLGVNQLTIPPGATAHGPKSAFRYAKIRFVDGPADLRFKAIRVDDIYYPVTYSGSFESSDPLLNRIWETGAYTARLCMQDDIWDAPKRDRGRWMGDTDVSGRVIEDVFLDRPLMEDTLDRLIGPAPVQQHVNGIPGYSSFWFTGVADYYRHTGDKAFLERTHARMVQLLDFVDKEFDERSLYANKSKVWLYVDWSPDFNGDTPETRRATTLEFLRAYTQAAWMLRELGDTANAAKYQARAAAIKSAAQQYLLDPATGAFGPRWQTNAAAVISGAADPSQYDAIWKNVLSQVGTRPTNTLIISPYYNDYVIRALAATGHRDAALKWIRQYWGGMVNEGATSFWEAYDPSWYTHDFHAALESDNVSGYNVSLAHGWSSGPTDWLMEQVLGIQPTGAGFSTVDIRPDLVDLAWARGAEPTPHGLLKVEARKSSNATAITLDIPESVTARVSVPAATPNPHILVNGTPAPSTPSENGTRAILTLNQPGHYELTQP